MNTNKDNAKFTVIFLKYPYLYYFKFGFKKYFIISTPTAPTTKAVAVAMAGIILPAINLTLKLST